MVSALSERAFATAIWVNDPDPAGEDTSVVIGDDTVRAPIRRGGDGCDGTGD
jgi:hypothetical protein